jgi:hypothetical protein
LKSRTVRPALESKAEVFKKFRNGSTGVVSQLLVATASHAACALSILAQNPDQHFGLVGCGAVPALVTALSSGETLHDPSREQGGLLLNVASRYHNICTRQSFQHGIRHT